MNKAQIVQYTLAILTFVISLLSDPGVREFLQAHPMAAISLLAAPSFITILRAVVKALRRAEPEAVDPSEETTDRIEVDKK